MLLSMGVLFALGTQKAGASGAGSSPRIRLSRSSMLLRAGRTKRLVLRNAGEKVIWSSSDIRVATVTDEGLVIAWGSGKCDITASFREKTYRCRVTVCENKKTYRYHRLRRRIGARSSWPEAPP